MPPPQVSEVQAAEKDKQLKRALGTWDISFLVVGAMIGSGWLFASLGAASSAGPAAILSWVLAGFLMLFVALAYTELGGMLQKSGGIVRYPQYAYGGVASYVFSWAYLLSAVSVAPSEAIAAVTYMSSYVSGLFTSSGVLSTEGITVAVLFLLVFFAVNWFGVRVLSSVNTAVGVWKVAIPAATVVLLMALSFHVSNLAGLRGGFVPYGWSAVLAAIPATGIAYSYLGFRQGIDFSGEAKKPGDVVKGTILGFLLVVLIYVLLQVSFIAGLNWSAISVQPGDWQAAYAPLYSGPFYLLMVKSGSMILAGFAVILLIDAVISPAGTGWIYIGTTARTLYGMAASGSLPAKFMELNSSKVPLWGTIAAFVVGFLFLLPFPTWYAISTFVTLTTVLTYAAGGPALITLRKTAADLRRPVKLPAPLLMGALAMVSAFLIVYWSTFYVFWFVFVLVMGGMALFFAYSAPKNYGSTRKVGYATGAAYLAILLISTYYLIYQPIIVPTGWPSTTPSAISLTPARIYDFVYYVGVEAISLLVSIRVVSSTGDERGKKHAKAGLWIFALIFAGYVLSFVGSYGVFSTPLLPFPWDTVTAVAVALVLYGYAVRSGIATEELAVALGELRGPSGEVDAGQLPKRRREVQNFSQFTSLRVILT